MRSAGTPSVHQPRFPLALTGPDLKTGELDWLQAQQLLGFDTGPRQSHWNSREVNSLCQAADLVEYRCVQIEKPRRQTRD
jgi:hypothetical protein